MSTRTKKATFNLHTDVLLALDEATKKADSMSKDALVEQALRKELAELKEQEQARLWAEAFQDPLFLKDIDEVEEDFRYADAETAREIV
jgi:hypothetical protein